MPWDDMFYIGTILDGVGADFATLKSLLLNLNKPVDPGWTFQPFSASYPKGDGGEAGVGFPRTTWEWQHRKDVHIEVLKALCPGLSAQVYIRTPTNKSASGVHVWRTYRSQMLWMPEDEDKQAGYTLGVTLEFRRLIIQAEIA